MFHVEALWMSGNHAVFLNALQHKDVQDMIASHDYLKHGSFDGWGESEASSSVAMRHMKLINVSMYFESNEQNQCNWVISASSPDK